MVTANAANAKNACRGVLVDHGRDTTQGTERKCHPKFWEYDLAYRPGIASDERRQAWTASESCFKSECVREAVRGSPGDFGRKLAGCRTECPMELGGAGRDRLIGTFVRIVSDRPGCPWSTGSRTSGATSQVSRRLIMGGIAEAKIILLDGLTSNCRKNRVPTCGDRGWLLRGQ